MSICDISRSTRARRDVLRRVDEQRNQVLVDRDALVPRALAPWSAVMTNSVSSNHGLLRALREEVADGVVGVLHRAVAPAAGRDVDAPGRIGIGAMIAGRHHVHEERPLRPRRLLAVDLVEHLVEQMLVGHAPYVLVLRRAPREWRGGRPSGSRWRRRTRSCCRSSRSRRRRRSPRSPCPRTRCRARTACRCSAGARSTGRASAAARATALPCRAPCGCRWRTRARTTGSRPPAGRGSASARRGLP